MLYVKLKWGKLNIHESQNASKLALSHMLECMQIAWCSYPCCSLKLHWLECVKECKVYNMHLEIDNGPMKLNVSFIRGHGRPHYKIHHNILALDMWPPIKTDSYQQCNDEILHHVMTTLTYIWHPNPPWTMPLDYKHTHISFVFFFHLMLLFAGFLPRNAHC
jgi:hypothetical protein